MYTQTSIQDFLATTPPFDQLSDITLRSLADRFTLLRYRVGQPILRQETLPYQIVVIREGKARLLGYDPHTQNPFTLQLLGPGAILGWAGLIRGVACETAIASEETVGAVLPASAFLDLLAQEPHLEKIFEQQVSPAELSDLLGTFLKQQAENTIDLKSLVMEALPEAIVALVTPQTTPNVTDDHAWFLSNGAGQPAPVGTLLKPETIHALKVRGNRPVRLIGIPQFLLAGEAQDSSAIVPTDPETSIYNDIPYAPDQPLEPDLSAHNFDNLPRPRYPYVRGKGKLGATLATFQMLAQHFEMPFRREAVRRVLADQLQRTGDLSLSLCGAVAEMLGLKAQLVKVPATAIPRLQPPALVQWQEGFAVLYETSQRELVLGVPELGILRRSPQAFGETWGQGGEVLLLQPTKATPQQKFGLQWFWPAIQKHRGVLITVFVASFFVQLFTLANPLIIQVIIDRVIIQNSIDTLHVLGFFLLMVALFEALLTYLRTYLFVDTTNRIDMALGSEIIDHLLRLPLKYFEKRPVGEVASRINELERIRQFLTGTALTVVLDAVFSVVYIVVMVFYSWKLSLASLGMIPLFMGLTFIVAPIIQQQLRAKAERNAETQSHLVEVVSGIQTVKAQNIELKSRWKWQERYARYVSTGFKTVQTATASSAISNMLNQISGLVVLWFGAALVLNKELSLGQLIAFRIISGYVTGPILRLAQVWQNFQETALSLERLSDIIDTPQEATEAERTNIPMPNIRGLVKYEGVSFRFTSGVAPVLVNINLEFTPGTFVGIVGQSGSGKSTLMKLLPRLYDLETGRILIDNYDVSKVELYSLRRQIGIVPQDSLLFEGTVQENIALTHPNATTDEIIEAAIVAGAHDFIMQLPIGYNSQVGEKGASLSGGQRQRIAIARTVLQSPQLLILDEATSALDYETERQVCLNLKQRFHDRTVFFITHRLSTIRSADVILVMDKGAAVEQGTHAELMAQRGRYYCLYQQQEAMV
jgi:ATP-binding cassette subfamily B protein